MLRLARDAARLPASDRRLAMRAVLWLAAVRIAILCCPYPLVRRMLDRVPSRHSPAAGAGAADCARAIKRSARVLPSSTCLSQALAGAALLRREGRSSVLNLHVGFDDGHRFEAHASLVAEGIIVAGDGAGVDWRVLMSDRMKP
ncbi:MAG: lasso peptide biosynthesis B2 protein [Vicinamibacterales bacterium]